MDVKGTVRAISFFLIGRYPFVNAITLLLLLGERAARETYPPLEPRILYGHLAVFVICGVCMGFNLGRKNAAMVNVGQLLYLAFSIYQNENLKYRRWVTLRMSVRLIGVAGVMSLYAFFTMPKPRQQHLRRLGEALIGFYLTALAYMLVESKEDRAAFTHHFPGGDFTLYIFVLTISMAALCFLPGYFVFDMCLIMMVVLSVFLLVVDCDIQYWTGRRGLDFWNQIRLIADQICIITGMFMYVTSMKKLPSLKMG